VVADVDASYLIRSEAAGLRVYGRSAPLFSGRKAASYFAQVLIGQAMGSVEGVFHSEGGRVVEPGAGFDYGAGFCALHLQAGYRHVANGVVYDSRRPEAPSDHLSGLRVVFGMTLRIGPH
jgi:hypothetical protein